MSRDRTVHAIAADGAEVVRYDRAGKWYIEYPLPSPIPRKQVSLDEAVRIAATGSAPGHRYGGQAFDARLRRLKETHG